MAYLTFTGSEENNTCFKFIGANSTQKSGISLISSKDSFNNTSILLSSSDDGLDTCSFYSGPSDSTILSYGESFETCGSIAYSEAGESCGSIAYSGAGESCGSVASSGSSGSSFSGGCSYCC